MRLFILLLVSGSFLHSCGSSEVSPKEESKKNIRIQNVIDSSVRTDSAIKKDTIQPLVITPQKIEGTLGQVTFSQNEKTMFYVEKTSRKGKIIVNGTEYILNKLLEKNGVYTITGNGIFITTSSGEYDNEGGDCLYGTFSTVTITLDKSSTNLKNVHVQDCPFFEDMGD